MQIRLRIPPRHPVGAVQAEQQRGAGRAADYVIFWRAGLAAIFEQMFGGRRAALEAGSGLKMRMLLSAGMTSGSDMMVTLGGGRYWLVAFRECAARGRDHEVLRWHGTARATDLRGL